MAIGIFKQEQMFMVEHYVNLRKDKTVDDSKLLRLSRMVTNQERIIMEL